MYWSVQRNWSVWGKVLQKVKLLVEPKQTVNCEASATVQYDTYLNYLSWEAKTSHHEVPYGTSKELAYFVLCRRRPARRETLAATKNSRPGRALRAAPRGAGVAPKASSQS